jgi:hypothetical protein
MPKQLHEFATNQTRPLECPICTLPQEERQQINEAITVGAIRDGTIGRWLHDEMNHIEVAVKMWGERVSKHRRQCDRP